MKSKLVWMIGAVCTTGAPLMAADESALTHVRACALEAHDALRLACYDSAIGRTRTGSSDEIGLTGELLRNQRRQAGMAETPPQSVHAKVVAVSRPPTSKIVVTLDNGQVWSQQELLEFPIEIGDDVSIRSGLLGVLWMVDGHRHRETRVTRIQ
jgi:hypothetical protein